MMFRDSFDYMEGSKFRVVILKFMFGFSMGTWNWYGLASACRPMKQQTLIFWKTSNLFFLPFFWGGGQGGEVSVHLFTEIIFGSKNNQFLK